MWSSRRRARGVSTVALAAVVVLAGCGFEPLYLSGGDAPDEATVRTELANVAVAPIPDRVGQLVRNDLVFLMAPTADAKTAAYRLDVRLLERISELAVERTGFATRANLRLTASFGLVDLATGKVVMNSRARAISSYNIVDASFSTLTAQNAARERAARRIAEDIRSRLGAYFAGREEDPQAGGATAPEAAPRPLPDLTPDLLRDPGPPPPLVEPMPPEPQPGRPR